MNSNRTIQSILTAVMVAVVADASKAADALNQARPEGTELRACAPLPLSAQGPHHPGAAGATVGTLWTHATVYYTFDRWLTGKQRSAFKTACSWWALGTGLTFVEGKGGGNYLLVREADSNYSDVGMVGGAQSIGIRSWYVGPIAHELGHAIGLFHEHQRADRDSYITALPRNSNDPEQFSVRDDLADLHAPLTAYDFFSIMHYPRNAFSQNGQATILLAESHQALGEAVGQTCMLSALDRVGAAKLYGGNATTCSIKIGVNDATMGTVRAGPADSYSDFDASLLALANPGVPIMLRAVPNSSLSLQDEFAFDAWEIAGATCADTSTDTITVIPRDGAVVKARFKRAAAIQFASRPASTRAPRVAR